MRQRQNGCHFPDRHLQIYFRVWKFLYFDSHFHEVYSKLFSIDSRSGLMKIMARCLKNKYPVGTFLCTNNGVCWLYFCSFLYIISIKFLMRTFGCTNDAFYCLYFCSCLTCHYFPLVKIYVLNGQCSSGGVYMVLAPVIPISANRVKHGWPLKWWL